MFRSLKIPKKLMVAFVALNLSAAAIMIVFAVNIAMISGSTGRTNEAQAVLAQVLELETAVLRQNSQMRGFVVTGDPSYLKSYYEGRDDYDTTSANLETTLADPAARALLLQSREETGKWRANVSDKYVDWVKRGQREQAQDAIREAGKAVLVSDAVLPLRDLREAEIAKIETESARQDTAIFTAWLALGIGGIALIGIALMLQRLLSRSISVPITDLTQTMAGLAAGRNDIAVPDTDRLDELGDMARAVLVFRDAAVAKVAAEADREAAMAEIGQKLHDLANSDLQVRLRGLPEAFAGVEHDFNDALERLCAVMVSVRGSIDAITTGSSEIRQAAADLSNRSEEQAARLQASATAMSEVTGNVGESAHIAAAASKAMAEARDEAEQGGAVVRKAIEAMHGIDQASREIAEIITVIDSIAFQTNLLALNAGVEAARAGDAGKGFAVVASEVRALAQRAADAASDVKSRISSATQHVTAGVQLVNETGGSLGRIIERVSSVSESIQGMAEAAGQQSSRLSQVNEAISAMDAMTQQNAAMVEQTTAATEMLAGEAEQLNTAFAIFKVGGDAPFRLSPAPTTRAARPRPVRPAPPPVIGNLAMKADDDWSEF